MSPPSAVSARMYHVPYLANPKAMSEKYSMHGKQGYYFLTETIVGWLDLFTRKEYSLLIIDSLNYCQRQKNLRVHAYCIMHSPVHLIASTSNETELAASFVISKIYFKENHWVTEYHSWKSERVSARLFRQCSPADKKRWPSQSVARRKSSRIPWIAEILSAKIGLHS